MPAIRPAQHRLPHQKQSCKSSTRGPRATAVSCLFLVVLGASAFLSSRKPGLAPSNVKTTSDAALIYVDQGSSSASTNSTGGSTWRVRMWTPELQTQTSVASVEIQGVCELGRLYPAPQGSWIAAQFNCESGSYVSLMDLTSGKEVPLGKNLAETTFFLSWSAQGDAIILKGEGPAKPTVYRVDVGTLRSQVLPVPGETYDLSFSPDGRRMLYSLSYGLGRGSETWSADADGNNARRILSDPEHILAFVRWSPTGQGISFLRMEDSTTPFTLGELFVADPNGRNQVVLDQADAGHGYEPAWSPDGTYLAYVTRENPADKLADLVAENLQSNLSVVNVKRREVRRVTQFQRTMVADPSWSPDGQYLAFSVKAGKNAGIWAWTVGGAEIRQLAPSASAQSPAWIVR